jgi:molecular chaperone DnaK (HSP70)
VAADFLRNLFNVLKSTLVRRLGETYVNSAMIRTVLTVPAVWSDKAKDATLQAAEHAGLSDHQLLVSEPEAAALYTLRAIQPNTIAVCTFNAIFCLY